MSTTTDATDTRVEAEFAQAMAELGADNAPLTAAARQELDREGFTIVRGVIDRSWLDALRARVDELLALEGPAGGAACGSQVEVGTQRCCDLVNKGAVFDALWAHPLLLAAARHILGRPFKLSDLNFREPLLGHGRQGLHADWDQRVPGERAHVANSLWLLDDLTAENGATRIVPRSHLIYDRRPPGRLGDLGPCPGEITLTAPAGSVVLFNAHLWHGGTMNTSGARRRMLHSYYVGREHPYPGLDQAAHMRLSTWRRLSPAQRWLSGVA
jgi:ectoine hydroxylase-related dioxygenase (phytanoyl-CoA dioxygenase family)